MNFTVFLLYSLPIQQNYGYRHIYLACLLLILLGQTRIKVLKVTSHGLSYSKAI